MFVHVDIEHWRPAPSITSRPFFAVGDIHGRHDLLGPLIVALTEFAKFHQFSFPVLAFLGDYIDRGRNGLSVLRNVMSEGIAEGFEVIRLPGNHEQMMLAFLLAKFGLTSRLLTWLDNGGDHIAREIDFSEREAIGNPLAFQTQLRREMGQEIIERLQNLPLFWRQDRYLLVHAGIHPRMGLKMLERDWTVECSNEDGDPLWIRGPFLTFQGRHDEGIVVVHGHTPRDEPEILSNRVNLDTRAYESGRLTAACFWQDRLAIIRAIGDRQERARGWL